MVDAPKQRGDVMSNTGSSTTCPDSQSGSNSGHGDLRVVANPTTLSSSQTTLTVTAYVVYATSQVVSSTGSTLTLNEATFFPASGTGIILQGAIPGKFSWTGKAGNQLTGVSGAGTPAAGSTCTVLPGVLTSYARDCTIRVWVEGTGKAGTVTPSTISAGDWSSGVATKLVTIHVPGEDDAPQNVVVEVVDNTLACAGFRGQCRALTVYSPPAPCENCTGIQGDITVSGTPDVPTCGSDVTGTFPFLSFTNYPELSTCYWQWSNGLDLGDPDAVFVQLSYYIPTGEWTLALVGYTWATTQLAASSYPGGSISVSCNSGVLSCYATCPSTTEAPLPPSGCPTYSVSL